MATATAIFVLDALTADRVVTLIALFAVPPFVASVGASRLQTLIVAIYSIALTVPAGLIDNIFGDFEHVLKTNVVALAAMAAVRVATVRDRAELGNALDYAVSNALATSPTIAEAMPRILASIGDLLGWRGVFAVHTWISAQARVRVIRRSACAKTAASSARVRSATPQIFSASSDWLSRGRVEKISWTS